ncbi:hypothetical protein ACFLSG_03590 [Candidatus Bipolaricaulota bacterium]
MPEPTVEVIPNADGSETTRTTEYYKNGNRKTISEETVDKDGVVRRTSRRTFKKGTDPGHAGPCSGEDVIEFDETGRHVDRQTTTTYKNTGEKKQEKEVSYERKKGKYYKRTIVLKTYCPPDSACELKAKQIEVAYWSGQRWRRKNSECKTYRWDCRTGRKLPTIAILFPGTGGHLGGVVCCVLALGFLATSYGTGQEAYLIGSAVAIGAALLAILQSRKSCMEAIETERAFSFAIEEDEISDPEIRIEVEGEDY